MQEISLDELDSQSRHLETVVDSTPLVDHWCSGPDWQIPVATAFAPDSERLILATEGQDGFALLSKYHDDQDTPMFGGMEPLWGFGTPILGRDPQAVATKLAAVLAARADWEVLFLPGMPVAEEPVGEPGEQTIHRPEPTVTLAVAVALSSLGQVGFAEGITRQVADLSQTAALGDGSKPESVSETESGYERWLGRRTARFRRNLRQATARAESEGLTIEDAATDPDLFDRLIAIEHRTWKGHEGSGITTDEMSTMYRLMVDRLRASGRLLVYIARHKEADVGYILGGLRARRYRGLQLSYTDDGRHLSVGNLLQNHQLQQLDRANLADVYDLGMDFDYKRRWADRTQTSGTLVVHRR